jgi:hypothetical protein
MTDLDEKVRSLLTVAAENITPESVPPLRLPEPVFWLPSGRRRNIRAYRWLAPVAAGAAVLAIVVAASVVAARPYAHQPATPAIVPGEVPAYYLAMTATSSKNPLHSPQFAGIYSTSTGKLVARITPPAARGRTGSVIGVSAAADDRTFLLTVAVQFSAHRTGIQFYLAKFDPVLADDDRAPFQRQTHGLRPRDPA